jgi:cyanophycinase-like exopeptidase
MLAEAKGLTEKALAMRALEGSPREHEEFRLRLEADRAIALEQIRARVQMSEQQAKVMAEAMGHADIKIVGGDGQFFDRFVKAVSLGSSIDGVFDNSSVVRTAIGDRLPGGGAGGSPEATLAAVLGNLMIKADDSTRTKLKALLEQARQLGVQDKVS